MSFCVYFSVTFCGCFFELVELDICWEGGYEGGMLIFEVESDAYSMGKMMIVHRVGHQRSDKGRAYLS